MLELLIALRYTRAKRRDGFISFISISSLVGIILGVTALITVLSVMNGFEKDLRERILGMASHATISAPIGSMRDWQQAYTKAGQHQEVVGAAPFIESQGLIVKSNSSSGVLVRGVNPELEPSVSVVKEKILSGSFDSLQSGEFNVVIGAELSAHFNLAIGDKMTLFTPKANASVIGVTPRMKRFNVSGIFKVGMYEYDRNLILINIEDAAKLYQFGEDVSGVRLKLKDMFQAFDVSREIANGLDEYHAVVDWTARHANFFRAIKIEKTVMFIILTLIIAVAAFNIVSTMVMVVTDKESEIAILRTLGTTPASIRRIFMFQGTIIGVLGTALGIICGVLLATNVENIVPAIERLFDVQFLDSSVYYISDIPSELNLSDVYKIGLVSLVLSIAATWFPARRAANIKPAEALRYE